MHQAQREISELVQIEAVIQAAQVCRLALWDQIYPYIVPMNFGYQAQHFYFHSALEGKKHNCIR